MILDNGKEIKAWVTIADYLASFSKAGEVGNIPEYYSKVQNRKNIIVDGSIGSVLRSPNEMILKVCGILVAVLTVLILLIVGIVKWIKKLRKR